MKVTTPVIVLLAALVASGCVGADADTKATSATTAAPPTVSDETGSITGLVVDDESKPIQGVQVAAQGAVNVETLSDPDGRFTINELIPGSYNLIAQKLGYDTVAKKVAVEAGQAVEAQLTLQPLLIEVPRVETFYAEGYIHFNIYTFAVGYFGQPLGADTKSFKYNATPGAVGIVAAMDWDESSPIAARYYFLRIALGGDNLNTTTARKPIVVRAEDLEIENKKKDATISFGVNFACGVNVDCFVNNPDAFVPQIAHEQRTQVYTNIFYVDPAPEGFTGLPT